MALNASARSDDSRSSPPVARALESPASSRRAAEHRAQRPRQAIAMTPTTITSTLTKPATMSGC
jgi:hypothetical protein